MACKQSFINCILTHLSNRIAGISFFIKSDFKFLLGVPVLLLLLTSWKWCSSREYIEAPKSIVISLKIGMVPYHNLIPRIWQNDALFQQKGDPWAPTIPQSPSYRNCSNTPVDGFEKLLHRQLQKSSWGILHQLHQDCEATRRDLSKYLQRRED